MSGPRDRKTTKLLVALCAATVAFAITVADATAQERQKRRNIFQFLFGAPVRQVEPIEKPPPPARLKNRSKAARATVSEPDEPDVAIVEKLETARSVLVVGDFLGSGLADALNDVFAENAGVRIADRTKGSSGFVRDDFYDWPAEIGALVEAEKPSVIVVMIGANDRQEMRVGGVREPKRSEAWVKEYEKRAAALAAIVRERKIPLVWVGVPSFKSSSMSSDMLAFNDIYREAAAAAGGEFVDIWDGFVDENGAYSATGPDVNGQPVRLRSGDNGVNLTKSGRRKVAF